MVIATLVVGEIRHNVTQRVLMTHFAARNVVYTGSLLV